MKPVCGAFTNSGEDPLTRAHRPRLGSMPARQDFSTPGAGSDSPPKHDPRLLCSYCGVWWNAATHEGCKDGAAADSGVSTTRARTSAAWDWMLWVVTPAGAVQRGGRSRLWGGSLASQVGTAQRQPQPASHMLSTRRMDVLQSAPRGPETRKRNDSCTLVMLWCPVSMTHGTRGNPAPPH